MERVKLLKPFGAPKAPQYIFYRRRRRVFRELHFHVIQFQNQAHIRNPHGPGKFSKTICFKPQAPQIFFIGADGGVSRRRRLHFFFFISLLLPLPKAVVSQMGAKGGAGPGGQEKSRRRLVFREYYINI